MSLDVNSIKGKKSVENERKMLDFISKKWKVNIIETNKHDSAAIDGFIVKNNIIIGLFESKCRNLSLAELYDYGSWLITEEKIKKGKYLSTLLKVPFLGFLFLEKDNISMFWKITDKEGNYLFEIESYKSETQATINGGIANRINSYLSIKNAQFIK